MWGNSLGNTPFIYRLHSTQEHSSFQSSVEDTWEKVKFDTLNPETDAICGCSYSVHKVQADQLKRTGGPLGGEEEEGARRGISNC